MYVKSLNMRKWMKERIQRRKKPAAEKSVQPAPPPLQPAYFDASENPEAPVHAEGTSSTAHEATHSSVANVDNYEAESISQPSQDSDEEVRQPSSPEDESPAAEPSRPPRSSGRTSGAGQTSEGQEQRGRGRRRRGGRGRGGRGREQAVAQAFTPAATKGIIPDVGDSGEAASAEVSEGEAVAADAAEPKSHAPAVPAAVPLAPPRPPKGIVVLAIGLPGSGKSSWFKRHSLAPLSSDLLRTILFDDVREQRFQDLVFSNMRSMLKARLIAKRPMNYVDATNLTPQERAHWIKLAKDYNYEVHAVFFDVPVEVCIDRHQRRDRVVPEDVMRRMASKLKPPAFDEGFAKITVVRVKKKEAAEA
jgi:predicted kinase